MDVAKLIFFIIS